MQLGKERATAAHLAVQLEKRTQSASGKEGRAVALEGELVQERAQGERMRTLLEKEVDSANSRAEALEAGLEQERAKAAEAQAQLQRELQTVSQLEEEVDS